MTTLDLDALERAALPRKAISIRQPWAWAIAHAGKDIENRDWPTRFRGPICIHAAKGMTQGEYDDAMDFIDRAFLCDDVLRRRARFVNGPGGQQHRGGIIGTAEIVGCVDHSDSPWFFGRYGFVLANVRPVEFIPVKGALGIFDWRDRVIRPEPVPSREGNDGD